VFAALALAAGDDNFVVALGELETALACVDEFDFLPGAGVDDERAPVVVRVAAGATVAGASAGMGSMLMLADSVGAGDVAATVRIDDAGAVATAAGGGGTYAGRTAGVGAGEAFATVATAGIFADAGICAAAATLGAGFELTATGTTAATAEFVEVAGDAAAMLAACAAGRVAVLFASEIVSAGVSLGSTNGGSPGKVLSGTYPSVPLAARIFT
jgi:hypothetical protein